MKHTACLIADSDNGGYGHGFDSAFLGYDSIDLVALADPNDAGREEAVKKTGVERSYSDYREMLEKEKPTLVAIAPRWPIHHKEYLLAAAEIGAHGYLEKPVAVDLAEVDEMVAVVEAKNLKWSVGFQISLAPSFLHAKNLIQEGLIGDVLEARARGKEDRRAGGRISLSWGSISSTPSFLFSGNRRVVPPSSTRTGNHRPPRTFTRPPNPWGRSSVID